MTKLTTERLEKLQDDLLQFQDHYSDPADKENYDIFVDALHMLDEFKAAKEKLMALLEAEPVGEFYHEKQGGWYQISEGDKVSDNRRIPLYAAPVLPKKPEPENKISQIKRQKALAWLKRVAYENPCMKEVKTCIEVLSAPAQPVIPEQALNTAKLINKFYERYPLETFANDNERAEALGYFMAGAELQCFGDFIAYDDHVQESE